MLATIVTTLNAKAIDLLISKQYDRAIYVWKVAIHQLKQRNRKPTTPSSSSSSSSSTAGHPASGIDPTKMDDESPCLYDHRSSRSSSLNISTSECIHATGNSGIHVNRSYHSLWNDHCNYRTEKILDSTITSINGMFQMYGCAFHIPTCMQQEYHWHDEQVMDTILSAYVLYNIGLTYHLIAITHQHHVKNQHPHVNTTTTTTTTCNHQALKFYQMTLHVFHLINSDHHHVHYCNVSHLAMAAVNNMGCVHSERFNYIEMMQCRDYLLKLHREYCMSSLLSLNGMTITALPTFILAQPHLSDPSSHHHHNDSSSNNYNNNIDDHAANDFYTFFSLSVLLLRQHFIASPAA
jgi:hypothetical protein